MLKSLVAKVKGKMSQPEFKKGLKLTGKIGAIVGTGAASYYVGYKASQYVLAPKMKQIEKDAIKANTGYNVKLIKTQDKTYIKDPIEGSVVRRYENGADVYRKGWSVERKGRSLKVYYKDIKDVPKGYKEWNQR